MRVASFAIALLIAASVSAAGQAVLKSPPVSFTVADASLAEVLDLVARIAALDIRIDDAVPQEVLERKVDKIVFRNADVESVVKFLMKHSGLTFDIVDDHSIYIRVAP